MISCADYLTLELLIIAYGLFGMLIGLGIGYMFWKSKHKTKQKNKEDEKLR